MMRLLVEIIHLAVEDTADELSELNVTKEAIDELDELVVDDEVNNQLQGGSLSSLGNLESKYSRQSTWIFVLPQKMNQQLTC